MPFRFRSIPVSLNAIRYFKLHGNGVRLHGTERNRNVTVFMAPTVHVHVCNHYRSNLWILVYYFKMHFKVPLHVCVYPVWCVCVGVGVGVGVGEGVGEGVWVYRV